MVGSQAHSRLWGWHWSPGALPSPTSCVLHSQDLLWGSWGWRKVVASSMATAVLTEQSGETEAQDGWGGCRIRSLSLHSEGGRWPNPSKAAGVSEGQRHGSGKVRESVRPGSEGLALSLLCHAALGPFPA